MINKIKVLLYSILNSAVKKRIIIEKEKTKKETAQKIYMEYETERIRLKNRHLFELSLKDAEIESLKRDLSRVMKDIEYTKDLDAEIKNKQESFFLISEKLDALCDANVAGILRFYQDTKNIIKNIRDINKGNKFYNK